jgi:hypothetical protein
MRWLANGDRHVVAGEPVVAQNVVANGVAVDMNLLGAADHG